MIQVLDPKDPDSLEPFTLDFTRRLEEIDPTETIVSQSVGIDSGPDSALVISSVILLSPFVTVWLSGGTLNARYRVRGRVITSLARILDLSFDLDIRQD